MESIRVPYKNDDFGNPIYARVSWATEQASTSSRPIALVVHGGGLVVGSSEIIPKAQTAYLAAAGFVVVAPNYRLAPQVTAIQAIADCESAYDWAIQTLPSLIQTSHNITVDKTTLVTVGHSTGGTLALHLALLHPQNVMAVTAFYPTLYVSDTTTSAHHPCTQPPFSLMPDFSPMTDDWAAISPSDRQVSEAELAAPEGKTPPPARNRWQADLLRKGNWMETICPDGDFRVLDPLTTTAKSSSSNDGDRKWPAVMLVQGDADTLPGSGIDLARRAEKDLTAAGVKELSLIAVQGANHMFDLLLDDASPGWADVVKGLDWLKSHV